MTEAENRQNENNGPGESPCEPATPTLQLRKARDTQTHTGICTHTSKVALKGWQLSRMYSSVTTLRRLFLKWDLSDRTAAKTF